MANELKMKTVGQSVRKVVLAAGLTAAAVFGRHLGCGTADSTPAPEAVLDGGRVARDAGATSDAMGDAQQSACGMINLETIRPSSDPQLTMGKKLTFNISALTRNLREDLPITGLSYQVIQNDSKVYGANFGTGEIVYGPNQVGAVIRATGENCKTDSALSMVRYRVSGPGSGYRMGVDQSGNPSAGVMNGDILYVINSQVQPVVVLNVTYVSSNETSGNVVSYNVDVTVSRNDTNPVPVQDGGVVPKVVVKKGTDGKFVETSQ